MAKILIVEDEKAINDLLKLNLEMVGHQCVPALTGKEDCSIETQSPTQEGKSYHHEIAHHHVADEKSATG